MSNVSRISGGIALLAAATMAATPAAAASFEAQTARSSVPVAAAWDSNGQNADQYRRYRYRHHDGIDGGDVLAGVLILGGIAAIASAASNSSRNRTYRYPDTYPNPDYRTRPYEYRPYRGDSRYLDSNGINGAIDSCVREIERDRRIGRVDSVDRLSDGWRVTGSVAGGEGFTCRVGNDGRIDDVDYGARAGWQGSDAAPGAADRQWSDDQYASARAAQSQAQPAYPGGPLPGDDAGASADDGRYATSQASDVPG
ncbi:MAG: hypothetical protein ACTHK5_05560 [Tsuneonella sp.]